MNSLCMYVCMWMLLCVYMCLYGIPCHGTHVEDREHLLNLSSLLPPCESLWNYLRASGLEEPLPTESSCVFLTSVSFTPSARILVVHHKGLSKNLFLHSFRNINLHKCQNLSIHVHLALFLVLYLCLFLKCKLLDDLLAYIVQISLHNPSTII